MKGECIFSRVVSKMIYPSTFVGVRKNAENRQRRGKVEKGYW